jgi:hypothetical protein
MKGFNRRFLLASRDIRRLTRGAVFLASGGEAAIEQFEVPLITA